MPGIPRSCVACRRWHSTCVPNYEVVDGVQRKTACKRCIHRNIECVYATISRTWNRRTGKRIEEARRLFGETGHQATPENSTTPLGNPDDNDTCQGSSSQGNQTQDTSETSTENKLRRHQRQATLVVEFVESVSYGSRIGFLSDLPTKTQGLAIFNLLMTFDMSGFHMNAVNLGTLGRIRLALLCAIGSTVSYRFPSSPCPQQGPSNLSSSSLVTSTRNFLTDETDLRSYGLARQPILHHFWQFCWGTFEENGVFDLNRINTHGPEVVIEELILLDLFLGFIYNSKNLSEDRTLALRRLRVKKFKTVRNDMWPSRQRQKKYFEKLLAAESKAWMANRELPIILDEDVLNFMEDPRIPPQTFLAFDRKTLPRINNLHSHHEVVWAAYLSVERMMSITAYSIPTLSDIEAERILLRMRSILQDHESWRMSTIWLETTSDGCGICMTPHGPEDLLLSKLDACSRTACHVTMLNLVLDRLRISSNSTSRWNKLYELCVVDVDRQITDLVSDDVMSHKPRPLWWHRRSLISLSNLPGGLGFLGEYLSRARNPQELKSRASYVLRLWRWTKQLSFMGQMPLWQLLEFENSFNIGVGRSKSMKNNPPDDSGSEVTKKSEDTQTTLLSLPDVVDRILKGALEDIGVI